jgi:hypothetical protein
MQDVWRLPLLCNAGTGRFWVGVTDEDEEEEAVEDEVEVEVEVDAFCARAPGAAR